MYYLVLASEARAELHHEEITQMDNKTNNYDIPKRDGSVWPEDICPAYTPREDAIPSLKGCWYCKYADFHLKEERALEVGICKWPNKIID